MNMAKLVVTILRDILNFVLFFVTFFVVIWYIYTVVPELTNLKNTLLPMKQAIILSLIISIIFVFINRLTTFFAIKIMKGRQNHG